MTATDEDIRPETLPERLRDMARGMIEKDPDEAAALRQAATWIQAAAGLPLFDEGLDDFRIDALYGEVPVQAEGVVGSQAFSFRASGHRWSMDVGSRPLSKPDWRHEERYGRSFEAGWMTHAEARLFIIKALRLYLAGAAGASLEPSG